MRPPATDCDPLDLESAADALLAVLPPDRECPARSEKQMRRQHQRLVNVDDPTLIESPPTQECIDEIRFLLSVTRLPAEDKLAVSLWCDGWTPDETASAIGVTAATVRRRLHRGLAACLDASGIAFHHASRHTTYSPPRNVWEHQVRDRREIGQWLRGCRRAGPLAR